MSTGDRLLAAVYLAATGWLTYCTVQEARFGTAWATALFAGTAAVPLAAICHLATITDLRALLRRHAPAPGRDRAVADETARGWADLAEACCLRGWETRGADHDPTTCAWRRHTT